jgi:hypothetical protein
MTLHALWLEFKFIQFYSGLTEELDSNLMIEFNSIQFNANTLIGIWMKLNQISVQQNSIQTIGLRFSWKKMKCKLMKKIFKICYAYDVGKKHKIKHKSEKTPFHASLLENGLNKFQTRIW